MDAMKRRAIDIIADRAAVPPMDAVRVLGRAADNDPAALQILVGDHHLTPDADGLFASAQLLRVLDRRKYRQRQQPSRFDLKLTRDDGSAWHVTWKNNINIGWIEVHDGHDGPLVKPSRWLGVWIAETMSGARFFTVSARAAQAILLRHCGQNIIEPDWAATIPVISLKRDQPVLAALQRVAEHVAAHVEPSAELLATAKLRTVHLAEVQPAKNPMWQAWQHRHPDDELPELLDVDTPEPLTRLATRAEPANDQWSIKAVARHLGLKDSTVRSYLSRGQMPPFDDPEGRWWRADTIRGWQRPGQGARNDIHQDPDDS